MDGINALCALSLSRSVTGTVCAKGPVPAEIPAKLRCSVLAPVATSAVVIQRCWVEGMLHPEFLGLGVVTSSLPFAGVREEPGFNQPIHSKERMAAGKTAHRSL